MTWIRFALWIAGIYAAYYGFLILWDHSRSSRNDPSEIKHELTFDGHEEPVKIIDEQTPELQTSSIYSSGGISLKQMFNIAREEGIEYIGKVSY